MAQIFIWVAASQPEGGYEQGDIIEMLDDGVHAGRMAVGPGTLGWDGDSLIPGVGIIDVPATVAQIEAAVRIALAMLSSEQIRTLVGIALDQLPATARNRLAQGRRVSVTVNQARTALRRSLKTIRSGEPQ